MRGNNRTKRKRRTVIKKINRNKSQQNRNKTRTHAYDKTQNRCTRPRTNQTMIYHVSPKVREYMYEEINKMLEENVIEPSNSDWSNTVVMIKKPNGKYRFCLDFRKVNKITKKDLYPIAIMAEILDALRSAKYISKIDLR